MRSFSEALYLAVTCHDYPQMWDPAAPLATRRQQLAAVRAAQPAARFAPFTATSSGRRCRTRARPPACAGPARAGPSRRSIPQAPYPAVPTLVVNGDLDNITATSGARVVASRFPRSSFVEIHNHGPRLRARRPRPLRGADRPPLRPQPERRRHELRRGGCPRSATLDRFPRRARGAAPADPAPGDRSSVAGRRIAAVAAATVADAIQRWKLNYGGTTAGCAAGAGAGAATSSPASASAAPASSATSGRRQRDVAARDRRGPRAT